MEKNIFILGIFTLGFIILFMLSKEESEYKRILKIS